MKGETIVGLKRSESIWYFCRRLKKIFVECVRSSHCVVTWFCDFCFSEKYRKHSVCLSIVLNSRCFTPNRCFFAPFETLGNRQCIRGNFRNSYIFSMYFSRSISRRHGYNIFVAIMCTISKPTISECLLSARSCFLKSELDTWWVIFELIDKWLLVIYDHYLIWHVFARG